MNAECLADYKAFSHVAPLCEAPKNESTLFAALKKQPDSGRPPSIYVGTDP